MVQEGIMRFALRKLFFLPNVCQNRRLRTQILIPGSTVTFPRHNGKCIFIFLFANLAKKSNYLKTESNYLKADFDISNLVLASERIKSRKHFVVKSIDFDRFMSSEGTKRLILVLTSKTGNSVEHTRHRIFLFGFFCLREDILRHFMYFNFRLQT